MKFYWWAIPITVLIYLSPPVIGVPIIIACIVMIAVKISSLEGKNAKWK